MRFDPVAHERSLLALLIAVVMLGPFAVDAYLPAFGLIARDLATSEAMVQYSIGSYLLGTALGPVFSGPVSDTVGRRPVLVWGLAGFGVFSVGCALVSNAEMLVFFRFLQALTGSASLLAGRALLADLYSGDRLSQRQSAIMMVMVIAPMIAPVLGGWVAEWWGWRWIFWGLAVGSVVAFVASFMKLPETLDPSQRQSLHPGKVLTGYVGIVKNPVAMMYVAALSSISGLFFVYVSATPFLYVETYGMSVSGYAWLFAAGAALAGAANFVNIYLVGRIGYREALLWQGLIAMACGALMFCGAFGVLDRWAVYAAGLIIMPLLHVIGSNALTGVMDQFEARKGIASAFAMSSRFGVGMIGVAVVGVFHGAVELRYGLIFFVFAALAGISAQMAVRWDKSR
ncbi:multidrug effflux MFS transporter [Neptunicoccus cionae]|uniref:Bcr/CflA family efflux transporter n=1 Tax=Neptunicoccus cionae TaxID=2035344 RepID=A0A916QZL3_9RHOB|nr:multidrug effflux MFS transporter [Amylibacter cionae]GGA23091.1 Bcr/CflA family drug resistance efflux transporter [Amylibacter cionae]